MIEYKKTKKINVINSLMLVCGIIVVSFFFPRTGKFNYEYEQGRPWAYSLITAPFDMPIYMDSLTVASTKDSINARFAPIYVRDSKIEKSNINQLYDALDKDAEVSPRLKYAVVECVREVYRKGIVDNRTREGLATGKIPGLRRIVNNVAEQLPTDGVYSEREAYVYLDSMFSEPANRAALSRARLSDKLMPNIIYDSIGSRRVLEQLYKKALAPVGVIQKGERIIDRGEKVTPQLYTVLQTYEQMLNERNKVGQGDHYPVVGQILLVAILFTGFFAYVYYFRPRTYIDFRKMFFLLLFVTVFTAGALVVKDTSANAIYLIPFATVPIILSTFIDSRTGFMANVLVVLVCALALPSPLEFIVLQVMAGIVAIVSVRSLVRRSQLVSCAFYVFATYCLVYIGMTILVNGSVMSVSKQMFMNFGLNGLILSFNYVLVFVLEKLFGFITPVSLVELSDVNNPELRELSEKCPGTFQHSLQVSNLAAEVAHSIGANVQLVRAGALYHDIGKISNPAFFTENQRGVNPHDSLTPDHSARIVLRHVTEGVQRAEKAKLPAVIKDFILQHHGKGKAKFFYMKACEAAGGAENVDDSIYTYPGPNPNTRETTILMIADATEAAAKSLQEHSDEAIRTLVERIIDSQRADGLYVDSPLTFREMEIVKKTIVERLCMTYHTRVSYNMKSNTDNSKK
ncbi:MAG: HDIG domain-containing protein [Muribaculaceae bacterium]|jgi:putative nucleotidyltransferase with HDIG domain|nr:HDIG domain-containing protein [Muribaculaceae bacterium]